MKMLMALTKEDFWLDHCKSAVKIDHGGAQI